MLRSQLALLVAAALAACAFAHGDHDHDQDQDHSAHAEPAPAPMHDMGHPQAFSTDWQHMILLFAGWHVHTAWQYALTLIAMFVLAIVGESLALPVRRVEMSISKVSADNSGTTALPPVTMNVRLLRTGLYGVRTVIHFLLMLAAMSYDVGIFIMIMAGFTAGYFFFSSHVYGAGAIGHEHA